MVIDYHIYNIKIAMKYGIVSAVLLYNIIYWVEENKADNRNFKDGYYWTFNTIKKFTTLFPELTSKQIRTALDKLRDEGLIITANYNDKCSRTLWYTYTQKALDIIKSDEECIVQTESNASESILAPEEKPKIPYKSDEKGNTICPVGQNGMPPGANNTNKVPQDSTQELEKEIHKEKADPVQCVYEYWNSNNLPRCEEITPKLRRVIEKSLKSFSLEEIKLCISRYAEVLHSSYFMSYRWPLIEFLRKDNAMPHFRASGEKWQGYLTWKKTGGEKSSKGDFIRNNYTKEQKQAIDLSRLSDEELSSLI